MMTRDAKAASDRTSTSAGQPRGDRRLAIVTFLPAEARLRTIGDIGGMNLGSPQADVRDIATQKAR